MICSVLQNSHIVLYSQASHRRSSGLFSGSASAWPQIKSSDSFQYSTCFSNLLEYKNPLRQWFSHLSVCKNITLLAKVSVVKAMVFLVVMYRRERWIIKKAEHWRIDAFELWCWRRLLRVPWTERRSNQSILKEINPEYSLEGLMLKLKLPYLGHLKWRAHSSEKTLILGKIEGRRRRGWQRMRWLDAIADSMNMNLNKLQEIVKDR